MSVDFLIIGGGIAGQSAAARMSHLGSVQLLEAEDALGYHASGRSAALFEENYGKESVKALNRASRDYHTQENGGVLSERGILMMCAPGDEDRFRAECAAFGLDVLAPAEAQQIVPILKQDAIGMAGLSWEAKDIDTERLMQDFAREARANGGEITTGARVTAIHRHDHGWVVETPAGDFSGRVLVNAAGAWGDVVAGMAGIAPLGLQPLRRSVARMPVPGGHDARGWPMIFGAGESWYAKPDAGEWIVSPAEEDPVEPHDAWAEDMVLAEGIARYQEFVTEEVTRLTSSWAGLRTFTPDRSLAIGFEKGDDGFLWVVGQGGYGMQTSPAASAHLADVVAGRAPAIGADIARELDPARFR